jgi:hypothetical protein
MITIKILFLLTISFLMIASTQYVFAGGPSDAESCYDNGYRHGMDKPFEVNTNKMCERFSDDGKNPYYEGFIDGCKSVEGNTEEICENATD